MPIIIAIDFGNQFCKVAVGNETNGGIPSELQISYLDPLLPSLLSIGRDKTIKFGLDAEATRGSDDYMIVGSLKRLLGLTADDPGYLEYEKAFIYSPIQKNESGALGLKIDHIDGARVLSSVQLVSIFLFRLVQLISSITREPVTRAVITVSTWFTDLERNNLIRACKMADLNLIGIIPDIVAASIGYSLAYTEPASGTTPRNVVFVDIGHSDTTVAVIAYGIDTITVKSITSDSNFGGRNIDHAIMFHLGHTILGKTQVDILEDTTASQYFLDECQRVKEALSATQDLTQAIAFNIPFDVSMTSETLNDLVSALHSTPALVKQALTDAGLTSDQVSSVELLGGSTILPIIKQSIQDIFLQETIISYSSATMAARGSLYTCSFLNGTGYFAFNSQALSKIVNSTFEPNIWQNIFAQVDNSSTTQLLEIRMADQTNNDMHYSLVKNISSTDKVLSDQVITSALSILHIEDTMNLAEKINEQERLVNMTPDNSPDKAMHLDKLANLLSAQATETNNHLQLYVAVMTGIKAASIAQNTPDKAKYFNNLAILMRKCYDVQHKTEMLDGSIKCFETASILAAETGDDKNQVKYLSNLSGSLHFRFQEKGNIADLNLAISSRRNALSLILDHHQNKCPQLNVLALFLESRFDRLADIADLRDAVLVQEKIMNLTVNEDSHKASYLFNLGVLYMKLFNKAEEMSDLDSSLLHQQNAVKLASDTDPQKPMYLNHLGESLQTCFIKKWDINDLNKAIEYFEYATKLVEDKYQSKAIYLNNLGKALGMYFTHQKSSSHLDQAILAQKKALELTHAHHKNRGLYLRNLALLLESHFDSSSNSSLLDLKEAIMSRQEAAKLIPDFFPTKAKYLADLVSSLYTYYKHSHNISDLNEAISVQRAVVKLCSNNEDKSTYTVHLYHLGTFLQKYFNEVGQLEHLEEAILYLKQAVDSTSDDNQLKAQYLSHFGCALHTRFVHLQDATDLDLSIQSLQKALDLTADEDPDKQSYVTNLAVSQMSQFSHFNDAESLVNVVKSYKMLVIMTPDDHPQRATRLNNLGVILKNLFEYKGRVDDLNEAILISQAAVDLTPDNDKSKMMYLSNLASAFQECWKQNGENTNDLDAAIRIQQEIVDKVEDGHPDKPGYLTNLGNALKMRFEEFGEIYDLDNAVLNHGKAVLATHHKHSQMPAYLNNLGNSVRGRFLVRYNIQDLQTAIQQYQGAVILTPDTHKNKAMYLHNLGTSLSLHFDFAGNIDDLDKAILYQETAFHMASIDGHTKVLILIDMGNSYMKRSNYKQELSYLQKAVVCFQDALKLTSPGHLDVAKILLSLGRALENIYEEEGDEEVLKHALEIYMQASQPQLGQHLIQFQSILGWINCASKYADPTVMEAYSLALEILPQLAWLGLSLEAQFERLRKAHSIACNAAATALKFNNIELALEWLEQGRSVVWNQTLQLRQPMVHLKEVNPNLANKIEETSKKLEYQRALGTILTAEGLQLGLSYQHLVEKQHRIAKEWNELMTEIQETSEFRNTFRGKTTSDLKEASFSGPIVVLNISETRCDAIVIVSPSLPLLHLHLNSISYKEICDMQNTLNNVLTFNLKLRRDDNTRYGGPIKTGRNNSDDIFKHILKELWIKIVKPILDLLQLPIQPNSIDKPHIRWCPTSQLTFLPLHAAGIYDNAQEIITLADYAISSYIPNLSSLLRTMLQTKESRDLKFLAVIQASTPGQHDLPATTQELAYIEKYVGNYPLDIIQGAGAMKKHVLESITNSSWVHLACHGLQNVRIPTGSGLFLHDGILTLREIIDHPLPNAEFAFLSACQTASGDHLQPDEAMHLAGGMMLAGFNSVIATMWSVGDSDAPLVAESVYSYLFRNSKPSILESAQALHLAVEKLRRTYHNASFAHWIPFIHMGL